MGDPYELLKLQPEELAGHLVQELKSYTQPFHPTYKAFVNPIAK